MHVLVPMDPSECSHRALEYAVELATLRGDTVDVVHYTDSRDEQTEQLVEDAEATLADADIDGEVTVVSDVRLSDPRPSSHIGRRILKLVDSEGYDQVVLGHHGTGLVGKFILGSTVETVIENADVPTVVVP